MRPPMGLMVRDARKMRAPHHEEQLQETQTMWPDRRLLDLFDIELPIVQAPMAGAVGLELIIAAADAGGLGSMPCAMLTPDKAREQIAIFKQRTSKPLNVNFFCHTPVAADA